MKQNFDWIEGGYTAADREALKCIKNLLEKGKTQEAMDYATWNCDTVVREAIPATVWKYMGGGLTKTGETNLKAQEGTIFFIEPEKATEISEVISDDLFDIWGIADLYMEHEKEAVRLAKEKYPLLDEDEIRGEFFDFVECNPHPDDVCFDEDDADED